MSITTCSLVVNIEPNTLIILPGNWIVRWHGIFANTFEYEQIPNLNRAIHPEYTNGTFTINLSDHERQCGDLQLCIVLRILVIRIAKCNKLTVNGTKYSKVLPNLNDPFSLNHPLNLNDLLNLNDS